MSWQRYCNSGFDKMVIRKYNLGGQYGKEANRPKGKSKKARKAG
jgi:hypothetical protein